MLVLHYSAMLFEVYILRLSLQSSVPSIISLFKQLP